MFIWRLVVDKIITYSEIENLSFIDALKLNAILDFRIACEQLEQDDLNKNNGDKS